MYGPVEIRNSCMIIHNYNPGDNIRLERMFSFWVKAIHQVRFMGIRYDVKNKDLYIPGGVELYFVIKSLSLENVIPKIPPDPYDVTSNMQLTTPPRDDRQLEAIRFCLGLEEYKHTRNQSQISLNLDTGVGKTYVMLFTVCFYSVKTIMITSNQDWLLQWKDDVIKFTSLTKDEVCVINGSADIQKLLNGYKDSSKIRFYMATHATLTSYAKRNGWEALREFFKFLRVGIKIFDEAHLYFDNICKIDFATNCWKTYYLTATPGRSDRQEDIIYQNAFKTVPKISLFDEDKDPHARFTAFFFNSHPSAIDIGNCHVGGYGMNAMNYADYFITRPVFFKMFKIALDRCFSTMPPEGRIAVYFAKNDVVLQTYRWLQFYYNQYPIGIYTSLTPKELKRQQLEAKIILTTSKSAQALLNIEHLKKIILLAEPFNSPITAKQIFGRLRDSDYTEMIELVDFGFEEIPRWYRNKRHKVYKKYATELEEITFTDDLIESTLANIYAREKRLIMDTNTQYPMIAEYKK